jgi:ATP-dependent protease ClpP protease subunit
VNKTASNIALFIMGVLLSTAAHCSLKDHFFSSKKLQDPPGAIVLTKSNHIGFYGPVSEGSVAEASIKLGQLSKTLPNSATIYLVLNTPGGSVSAGNRFIDFANSLPQTIKPICIFCASMGYHFFQSFGERIAFSSSTLMSHRASLGGIGGQIPGELDVRLNHIKEVIYQMDVKVSKRVGLSVKDYQTIIHDELWLDGESAVRRGHADKIAKVSCSKDLLDGVKTSSVMTIFGPFDVTVSECPLITGPVDAKLGKDSKVSKEAVLDFVRTVNRRIVWSL